MQYEATSLDMPSLRLERCGNLLCFVLGFFLKCRLKQRLPPKIQQQIVTLIIINCSVFLHHLLLGSQILIKSISCQWSFSEPWEAQCLYGEIVDLEQIVVQNTVFLFVKEQSAAFSTFLMLKSVP